MYNPLLACGFVGSLNFFTNTQIDFAHIKIGKNNNNKQQQQKPQQKFKKKNLLNKTWSSETLRRPCHFFWYFRFCF